MWTSSGSTALPQQQTYVTGTVSVYGTTYIASNTTWYGASSSSAMPPMGTQPLPALVPDEEDVAIDAVLDENEKLVIQIAELEKELARLLGLDEE